jgi:hypothetical protein
MKAREGILLAVSVLCLSSAAATVRFHGVMGQSAAADEPPLGFTGVTCLSDGPDGRVFFGGDDGLLYEIRNGRPVATGARMPGNFLHWDGKTFRALGANDVWEIDPKTLAFRHVVGTAKHRFDFAAVVPSDPKHPFAKFGRYVTYDAKRDALVALDDRGEETGVPFALAPRLQNAPVCGLGFLANGDLAVVSYYPDLRIYRYRADGTQFVGRGWPVNRGFGAVRLFGGEAYHVGREELVRLTDNMASIRRAGIRVGAEGRLMGYAKQGTREFVATSQGLYFRDAGEDEFRRRFGGIRPLSALAANGRYVYLSMGGTVRRMMLDADETTGFDLSDDGIFRVNGSWTLQPLDFRVDGENLLVAAGAGGEWLFKCFPPKANETAKRYWEQVSKEPCEAVNPPSVREKLLKAVSGVDVPGGFAPGKIARTGRWIVAEDPPRHRLLRFRIEK